MTKKTYNIISSVLVGVSVGVGMYFDLTLLERILAVIIMPGSFLLLYRKKLKKWIYSVLIFDLTYKCLQVDVTNRYKKFEKLYNSL